MNIPNDPIMLMSFLNTQLRDNYSSLEDLVKSNSLDQKEINSLDQKEIEEKLANAGYHYDVERNQFVR